MRVSRGRGGSWGRKCLWGGLNAENSFNKRHHILREWGYGS